MHVQVIKTDGCRANEQQKQQKQKQQKQKQQQRKQKQPKQTGDGKTRVSSLSPDSAVSVDGLEVSMPAICADNIPCPRFVCSHARYFCVGCTISRVCGGQGHCETA